MDLEVDALAGDHPVLRTIHEVGGLLTEMADVPVELLSADDKRRALHAVTAAQAQVESLRLRLAASAGDVAADDGCRDVAAWLATRTRQDPASSRRTQRLAAALQQRWTTLADALAQGRVTLEQTEVIVRSLDALPARVPAETLALAETHLLEQAAHFGPRELRTLGRRVLDVVAPEIGEDHERRALEAEEDRARRTTSLTTHRRGDGTSRITLTVPDITADRLLTALHAYTSPRHTSDDPATPPEAGQLSPAAGERVPHDVALGQAFCSLLEALDPARLPLHGGDATTLVVTIDLATLTEGLGTATTSNGDAAGQGQITAGQARRLACTAHILPMVLGGASEILDLGRARRLFSRAQRRAMAVRDRTCRAHGCDMPAPWCEAHHARQPWATGGRTDLDDGLLLCSFHHHRAHDPRYHHTRLPDGDLRFHRRRKPAAAT